MRPWRNGPYRSGLARHAAPRIHRHHIQLRAIQRVLSRRPNEGVAALDTVLTSADTALRDARNAIWDMRAVELEGRDLPDALEGAIRSMMRGHQPPST